MRLRAAVGTIPGVSTRSGQWAARCPGCGSTESARSSSRRAEFGRSRVAHKERKNAADASFQPRSSCADRRRVEEEISQWFFLFSLTPDCCLVTLSPSEVGRLGQVFGQRWEATGASNFWPLLPFKAFSCCSGSTSVRGSKVHLQCELICCLEAHSRAVPVRAVYSWGQIEKGVISGPFLAMELIYCSLFLLPCFLLDWALRTSAEEGESDDAETFPWLHFFLPEAGAIKPN